MFTYWQNDYDDDDAMMTSGGVYMETSPEYSQVCLARERKGKLFFNKARFFCLV